MFAAALFMWTPHTFSHILIKPGFGLGSCFLQVPATAPSLPSAHGRHVVVEFLSKPHEPFPFCRRKLLAIAARAMAATHAERTYGSMLARQVRADVSVADASRT
jgi:hypothetical protein